MPTLASLDQAQTFEDGTRIALDLTLQAAHAALAQSRWSKRGRIMRGMLHLRSDEGYQDIVVRSLHEDGQALASGELGPGELAPSDLAPELAPSSTAWRWIKQTRDLVCIDVLAALLTAKGQAPTELDGWLDLDGGAPTDTARRMLQRQANMLCAVPLTGEDGEAVGMLSLEAECYSAMGQGFIWSSCAEELAAIADVTSQSVLKLPRAQRGPVAVDPTLPVVGQSMAKRIKTLRFFSRGSETLLLSGATGAGKTRIAAWCHASSPRAARPFVHLDLMATPESLQTAHLFGWQRGAFTGADRDHVGAVTRAQGGTLFIDEIDKLSLEGQAALLRLVDSRTYQPLGSSAPPATADVRFIVATNIDLQRAVDEGRFREDLYFRVNVLPMTMPPLAQRLDEVEGWAEHMLRERAATSEDEPPARLHASAVPPLRAFGWPGNLRQLNNVVRRAYTFARMAQEETGAAEAVVGREEVLQSLRQEQGHGRDHAVLCNLRGLAVAWVDASEQALARGEPLSLEHLDAVKAFALEEALRREGNLDDALRLVGRDVTVRSRNQKKYEQSREEQREALLAALEALSSDPDAL